MSERDWSDLDRRLDEAIDALNDERAPELASDAEEMALLDVVRAIRRLREPDESEGGFEDLLVERILADTSGPELATHPNGVRPTGSATVSRLARPASRRKRLILSQIAAVLRVVGVFVLAGMISGAIVGGLGGRVAMRVSGYLYQRENPGVSIVTESSGEPIGQISLGGTMNLIVESMGSGAVIGILLLIVAPWLPRSGWRRAGGFGAVLLAVVGATVINTDNRDMRLLGSPVLNILMFAALIVAAGMLATPLVTWVERAVGARGSRLARVGAQILGGLAVTLGGAALLPTLLLVVANAIVVPIHAVAEPGLETLVVAPLLMGTALSILLARLAVAFPNHLPWLARLRTRSAERVVMAALVFATAAGLIAIVIGSVRIVTG